MEHAENGQKALQVENYGLAIRELTLAISEERDKAENYICRSIAFIRDEPTRAQEALQDAERAIYYARKTGGQTDLIVRAQIRRMISLYHCERFADALKILEVIRELDSKEKTLLIWEPKLREELSRIPDTDPRKIATVEATVAKLPDEDGQIIREDTVKQDLVMERGNLGTKAKTPLNKVRYEWYQSDDTIFLNIMARNVEQDHVKINIQDNKIYTEFPVLDDDTYKLELDPLYSRIIPEASGLTVKTVKVEITLKKATSGEKWTNLQVTDQTTESANETPVYPSSSRKGTKNWDQVILSLTQASKDGTGSVGGKEIDQSTNNQTGSSSSTKLNDSDLLKLDDTDEFEGDEVGMFFKRLYANSDPDTRRAMIKSYTESNGTALSTNWSEVQKGKVQTTPPDGMEAKTWSS